MSGEKTSNRIIPEGKDQLQDTFTRQIIRSGLRFSYLIVLLFSLSVYAKDNPENLLANAVFDQGLKGWRSTVSKEAGYSLSTKNGKCFINVPKLKLQKKRGIFLLNTVNLTPGKNYVFEFTLKTSGIGSIEMRYTMNRVPHSPLGFHKVQKIAPGRQVFRYAFTAIAPPPGVSAYMLMFMGLLPGQTELYDIKLYEIPSNELPVTLLNKNWQVFANVKKGEKCSGSIPAFFEGSDGNTVSPLTATLKNGSINIGSLCNTKVIRRTPAILYNEFNSPSNGIILLKVSADWWMEVCINGAITYSTMTSGNGKNPHFFPLLVRKGKNLLAIKVLSGSRSWRFSIGKGQSPIIFHVGKNWKAVNASRLEIKAGTALDLSGLYPKPAGKFGRPAAGTHGQLTYSDHPDKELRLIGWNLLSKTLKFDDPAFKSIARKYAVAASRQGYNQIRFMVDGFVSLDSKGEMSTDPEILDRLDFLISEFKRNGIYFRPVLMSYRLYTSKKNSKTTFRNREKHKLMMYLGNQWERERFRNAVNTLLNHVNPYTGLAWKNDPAISLVEFYNEQYSGIAFRDRTMAAHPDVKKLMLKRWRKWLHMHGRKDADKAEIPSRSATDKDFSLFLMDMVKENNLWYEKQVRDAGYTGLTSQNCYFSLLYSAATWETLPAVDEHRYYAHPSKFTRFGSIVDKSSSIARSGDYWRSLIARRLSGRPFFIGEYNHSFWNPYRYEGGLLFSAYSSLQGFSSMSIHSRPVRLISDEREIGLFSCYNSPISRAGQFISACLFARGDVQCSDKSIHLSINNSYLKDNALKTISTEQSKIALISKLSIVFPELPTPKGVSRGGKADLTLYPSDAVTATPHDWYVDVSDRKDTKFNPDKIIEKMKSKKILPPDNISKPSQGIFQSDTGEISMFSKEKTLKVVTPKSEGVCFEGGKSVRLGQLTVNNSSIPACVALCTVDGKQLKDSTRMVLIYSTEEANSGMILAPDRETLMGIGYSPVLLRVGKLDAQLEISNASNLELYALGLDGTRREKLPLTVKGNVLQIKIDTAQLKDGPTTFFELVAKQ